MNAIKTKLAALFEVHTSNVCPQYLAPSTSTSGMRLGSR